MEELTSTSDSENSGYMQTACWKWCLKIHCFQKLFRKFQTGANPKQVRHCSKYLTVGGIDNIDAYIEKPRNVLGVNLML